MANPMQALVQLSMAQHPQGPNIGGPMGGAGGDTLPSSVPQQALPGLGSDVPQQAPPGALEQLLQNAQGPTAGNPQAGAALVAAIQKVFPKLKLAEHHNGVYELHGPAQDQFLGGVYARAHGAKMHSVHNVGKGQRLHVAV